MSVETLGSPIERKKISSKEKTPGLLCLEKRARGLMLELNIPVEEMNQLIAKVLKDPNIAPLFKNRPNALETICQANLFSDLGKGITPTTARIYKIDSEVENPETTTLSDFLLEHFGDEQNTILDSLEGLGVTRDMTMRDFFNLHTIWSLEIIDSMGGVVSEDVRNAVARHHASEGVTIIEGELTIYDKVVIVIDKYDACRTRGSMTHEQAIAYLRKKLEYSKFKDDPVFDALIQAFDRIAPNVGIYEESMEILTV